MNPYIQQSYYPQTLPLPTLRNTPSRDQANQPPTTTLEPNPSPELHKTTLETAKLHQRRLEHAVLLSALRSRVPYTYIPGILASVSGRDSHDYRSSYGYQYGYGYEAVYVVPGGIVVGSRGFGPSRRILDDSFLRRAYKRRDLVKGRNGSVAGKRQSLESVLGG